MKKIPKKIIRPLIVGMIVVAIAAIWFVKNGASPPEENALDLPLEITEVNLEEIKSYGLPVILDFGSDSCIPCKEMAPVLAAMNAEMQGKAVIHFTDVWKYPEAAKDLPIQVIPTQVLINADGTPYVPSDELVQTIPGFQMYSTRDTNEHVFTTHQGGLTEEQMRAILTNMGVASE